MAFGSISLPKQAPTPAPWYTHVNVAPAPAAPPPPPPTPYSGGGTGAAAGGAYSTPSAVFASGPYSDMWSLFQAANAPAQLHSQNELQYLTDQELQATLGAQLQQQMAQQSAGFNLQNLDISQGALAREQSIDPQLYALQQQEAQNNAAIQQRNLDSSLTARGAYTSIGGNQQRQDIATQLSESLQGIGLSQQQTMGSLADQVKRLGISRDQVNATLENSLRQIGISSQDTIDALKQQAEAVMAGEYSPYEQFLTTLLGAQGVLGGNQTSSGGGGLPNVGLGNVSANSAAATSGDKAAYQNYASQQLGQFGWGADQMPYLIELWNRESGWNPNAQNPTSTAYGIAQFLDTTWQAAYGGAKSSNPYQQIDDGLKYIQARYGSPQAAWNHETSIGWY